MATAIICEFNPFHNGHMYLLNAAKGITGAPAVAVMSGSFTQRGEPAVTDKFTRAASALRHGADLVVELPTVYAVSPAQRFARGGVALARSFPQVDTLAFGCETDDLSLLTAAADAPDNPRVQALTADKMRGGDYYPRALESAVRAVLGGEVAAVLQSPNNILAVEYLRALRGSGIAPLPIRRVGVPHDGEAPHGAFASASLLREKLRAGEDVSAFMPDPPQCITRPEHFERALLMRLRSMTAEELAALPEVSEGLENRILDAVRQYNSVGDILSAVKSKRYTHARLRRILTCALLGVTAELQSREAAYARVLGFTEKGGGLLRGCAYEVVTSPAKALKVGGENAGLLRLDLLASDLLGAGFDAVQTAASDYRTKIIRPN